MHIHIVVFKMKISKLVQNPWSCVFNTAAGVSLLKCKSNNFSAQLRNAQWLCISLRERISSVPKRPTRYWMLWPPLSRSPHLLLLPSGSLSPISWPAYCPQTRQVHTHHRAFALAVFCAWNTLPSPKTEAHTPISLRSLYSNSLNERGSLWPSI